MDLEQTENARAQLSPGAPVRPADWTTPTIVAIVRPTGATAGAAARSSTREMPR